MDATYWWVKLINVKLQNATSPSNTYRDKGINQALTTSKKTKNNGKLVGVLAHLPDL